MFRNDPERGAGLAIRYPPSAALALTHFFEIDHDREVPPRCGRRAKGSNDQVSIALTQRGSVGPFDVLRRNPEPVNEEFSLSYGFTTVGESDANRTLR